jgi:hypothetical protein
MDAEPSLEHILNNGAQRQTFHTALSATQAIGRASAVLGVKAASDVASQALKALKVCF